MAGLRSAALATLLAAGLTACASESRPASDAGAELDTSDLSRGDDSIDTDAAELPDLSGPVCLGDTRTPLNAIVNGTDAPTWAPLTDEQLRRIVRLDFGGPGCTGVLVGDGSVLAAAHCVDTRQPAEVLVELRIDGSPTATSATTAIELHPDLDLALLSLTTPLGAGLDALLPNTEALDSWVGRRVESAGFGVTGPEGGSGRRRFVVEPIVEVTGDELVLDGENQRGLCAGDSGAPALALADDASVRVLGLLTGGSHSCVEADRFVRLDRAADWLAERLQLAAAVRAPCRSLSPEGVCDHDRALYCAPDDTVAVMTCEDPALCRFDAQSSAFRCSPAAPDPCLGLDRFGACDGNLARWCDGGVLRERDCGSCDRVCGVVDGRTGVDCLEPVCDGIGIAGECVGEVARWCFRGALVVADCAGVGVACSDGRCECEAFGRDATCVGDASVRCNGLYLDVDDCAGAGRVCEAASGTCR